MPTPVSRTVRPRQSSAGRSATRRTWRLTSPAAVNLIALPSRLRQIWRIRPGSPRSTVGTSGSISSRSAKPLSRARGATIAVTRSRTVLRSKSMQSSSSRPASIRDRSRMSLMIVSRASPESSTASTKSRCSLDSGVSSSSRVIPMTPFMGSRISWLMVARNSDFASLARAAAEAWLRHRSSSWCSAAASPCTGGPASGTSPRVGPSTGMAWSSPATLAGNGPCFLKTSLMQPQIRARPANLSVWEIAAAGAGAGPALGKSLDFRVYFLYLYRSYPGCAQRSAPSRAWLRGKPLP